MSPSRILVVEDEAVVAKDLQGRLKKLGYDVPVTVPTGEEAIQQARELRPALILMDIRLKGELDGIQTAARIQDFARTPVIYLTAYADEGTLHRAKMTEPFGYILKPFNERELHTAIQVALHKHGAEVALRKSERWLAATLKGMGEAVIAMDATGEIVFMNPLAQILTGWPANQAVGRPLGEVFRAHDPQTGIRVDEAMLFSILQGRLENLKGNNVLITRNGPARAIEDSAASIFDDDGNVSGGVLVFRDVTERKQAEEALRLSEEKFRLLVNGIDEYAIFMLDREGLVESWNPGSERIQGYQAEEVLGKSFSTFYTLGDIEDDKPMLALQAAARNGVYQEESRRVRKDGTQFLADVVLTALRDSAGRPRGFVQLTRDITQKRREEDEMQQRQKLESLGLLAGGIAHDFNNLLTGILGNCCLVLDKLAPDDPRREDMQDATRACIRAADLTQQLLAYAGKSPLETKPVDLSVLVREIASLVRASVSKNVDLHLELNDFLPAIEGDESKLHQVVMNLIINAAESMEGRTGSVKVRTGLENGNVALTVQDSGCGMDDHTLARIFDPFFTTKFQGRGLGLAAVQGIVRGHGGTLHVATVLDRGTTFKVLLPVAYPAQAPVPPEPERKDVRGTERVLIVDDEDMVRSMAVRALKSYGYIASMAASGPEALQLIGGGAGFDLILLDLTMPGMSGAEMLPLLRELDSKVPVIVSTGFDKGEVERQFSDPRLAFIQKPYTVFQLAEKVRSVLDSAS